MIIEVGGGSGGFKEYLETGQKKGREMHRDQLDQRIPLAGDLDAFEIATSIHEGSGHKYDHLTLSFSEHHVSDEMLQIAVNELRDHVLAAWPESERDRIAFYAEAHRPRVLSYTNSESGETVERLTHIHVGIGRHDLLTGEAIEPLGFLGEQADNIKFLDAFQESFNSRHGFSSPKDNPKITTENAVDTLARYTGARPDDLGTFNQRKAALEVVLQKEIIARNVTSWGAFGELLAEHGTVTKIHEDKFNESYRIKPHGSDRAMRLSGVFFQRQFIERQTAEKISIISAKARTAYLEQMQPRKAPEYLAGILAEWHQTKARELRYLHTGSPFYKSFYLPADVETRQQLLDEIERKHHAVASPANDPGSKKPISRKRVPGVLPRNLDGILRRSEMLLRRDDGLHVRAEPKKEPDSAGLRQTDGVRSAGQPSSIVARMLAEQRERYEQAADKERYTEIRRHLDCTQLLSALSHSHGLNPDLYRVGTAKDGSPRIQCGSRSLSPSDFLTKELGLPWKEAAPILRQTYEHQINGRVTKPRRDKVMSSELWKEFKAEKKADQPAVTQRLKEFDVIAKTRRVVLVNTLKIEQKAALAGLTGPARQAAHSLQKLHAATAKADLVVELKKERQILRDSIQPIQADAWRCFLQARAQAGNEQALNELRKLDDTARANQVSVSAIAGTIVLENEKKQQRSRESGASLLKALAHAVEVNGDITYRHHGQAILRDEGRRLAVLDENSDEAIVVGLILAREKFGTNLTLTGSQAFQQRVVQVAVANGIAVKFVDPQLETYRQRLLNEKNTAKSSFAIKQMRDVPPRAIRQLVQQEPIANTQPRPEAVPAPAKALSAQEWATAYLKESGKEMAGSAPGSGTIIYIEPDGLVLDRGRTISIHPLEAGDLQVGAKAIVAKDGTIQLAPELTKERNLGR